MKDWELINMANIDMTGSDSILKRKAKEEGNKTQSKSLKEKSLLLGIKKQRPVGIPLFKI